jgi:hypothetical protein
MTLGTQNPDGCCGTVLPSAHGCMEVTDAWKVHRHHLNNKHWHKDMEMKDFASVLAHDVSHNDFDQLTSEDGVLVIDSGRRDMQSMMSSLGGGGGGRRIWKDCKRGHSRIFN